MATEKTYFQEDWLSNRDYKAWFIAADPRAKTKAYFKRCFC